MEFQIAVQSNILERTEGKNKDLNFGEETDLRDRKRAKSCNR